MLKTVLPAIGINALGWVYVCGLSFVPAPATGIIAFIPLFFDGLLHHYCSLPSLFFATPGKEADEIKDFHLIKNLCLANAFGLIFVP
jgi:hypothetical protein